MGEIIDGPQRREGETTGHWLGRHLLHVVAWGIVFVIVIVALAMGVT